MIGEGDVLYDEMHDTTLTISDRDGKRVTLGGRYINETTIESIEKRFEEGRYVFLERSDRA